MTVDPKALVDPKTIQATLTSEASKQAQLGAAVKGGTMIPAKAVSTILADNPERRTAAHLRHGSKAINESADVLEAAHNHLLGVMSKLVATEKALDTDTQKLVGRAKDRAQQTADALARINKMLGPEFEPRLIQLERLVAALDKLNDLQSRGLLTEMMAALLGKKP